MSNEPLDPKEEELPSEETIEVSEEGEESFASDGDPVVKDPIKS